MTLWLDNQLPPALAAWMRAVLSIDCLPVRDLKLQLDPLALPAHLTAPCVPGTRRLRALRGISVPALTDEATEEGVLAGGLPNTALHAATVETSLNGRG